MAAVHLLLKQMDMPLLVSFIVDVNEKLVYLRGKSDSSLPHSYGISCFL